MGILQFHCMSAYQSLKDEEKCGSYTKSQIQEELKIFVQQLLHVQWVYVKEIQIFKQKQRRN